MVAAWYPQPMSATSLSARLPTVCWIWRFDSHTPKRSTRLGSLICPKDVARVSRLVIGGSVPDAGGVQQQGEAEGREPDGHEQQTGDREIVDRRPRLGQYERVPHVVNGESDIQREPDGGQHGAHKDRLCVVEQSPQSFPVPVGVVEEDVGQASEVDALQPD